MKPHRKLFLLMLAAALAPSCAMNDKGKDKPEDGKAAADAHMAELQAFRQMRAQDEGTPIKPGGNAPATIPGQVEQEFIAWTSTEGDNQDVPELATLMEQGAKNEGPWKLSDTNALREAKRTGKPVLIWFTDSQNPQVDRPIGTELFNRDEFETWAKENVIRLRVDQTPSGTGAGGVTMGQAADRKAYVKKLKEHYKVLGYPTLLVLSPAGDVVSRIRGFSKGQGDFKWGQIRQGAGLAKDNYQKTRADLMKKGYRDWSDGKGRTLFAKLTAYRDGELILTEPDGQRSKTKESHLSDEDQDWIRSEKEKRGIH